MIDYSKAIEPGAIKVEFMIFFDIGDADTPDISINFVRVENTKDYHYNTIVGRRESTFWSHYSESFLLETDGTNKVFLSVEKEYPGFNAYLKLYVTGYYL